MALSPEWLDRLRSRVVLSALIGRTTKLQRAGREWKACCPFHGEKTPSFTVNDTKGFYHCFGCEAHGDAIRWLTDSQGLSFMDAVKELAAEAGMDLPAPDPAAAARAQARAGVHDVLAAAQDWFVAQLHNEGGTAARAYLDRRGLGGRVIEQFGFGFAPARRDGLKTALARFDEALLVEAGLLIAVEGKPSYDRFRARVMLPIHDARGRVIAFGGRILDAQDNAPKYLNSPDTPVFDKGATLYNLHRAAGPARKAGRLVVVEGYMDAVALGAAGIEEAVAPLGTALTERQLDLAWRMADRPLLCFDGDGAGQRAAGRAMARALPLIAPSRSLGIVRLPHGQDPDDVVRTGGAEAMEAMLAEPLGLLDALWCAERDAAPLATPEDKAGLKARLMEQVATIADRDIRALYKRELLERFSAFAFPPRDRSPRAGFGGKPGGASIGRRDRGGRGGWGTPAPPPPSAELLARVRGADGRRGHLSHAVLAGFARYPAAIPAHTGRLIELARIDPGLGPLIDDLLDAADTLEDPADLAIYQPEHVPQQETPRIAFLAEGTDPHAAFELLDEALTLLVEKPAVDAAIAAATERLTREWSDDAYFEQQRLMGTARSIDERLIALGRRRAAAAPVGNIPADGALTSDEEKME